MEKMQIFPKAVFYFSNILVKYKAGLWVKSGIQASSGDKRKFSYHNFDFFG